MTIGLAINVNDGLVIAADSATTLMITDPATGALMGVQNVYDSANKVFNLHKGSPIGAYTFGAGSIGDASISTLAKDFRELLTNAKPINGWRFDPNSYTIEQVAIAARHFLYEERYVPAFAAGPVKPVLGFNVGGFSSGEGLPELWQVIVDPSGSCPPPSSLRARGEYGITWAGEPEAIQRLILGYGTGMPQALVSIGLPAASAAAAITAIQSQLEIPFAPAAMPIIDVAALAEFLVDLTIKFSRFKPGAPTVGGPIEIAAITKHERFKWIRRKHYYDAAYNPGP